jgi:predicted membrane protein
MRFSQIPKILLLIFLIGGISACVAVGDLVEETETVELGEAESVELDLDIGAGELKVQGGAKELMEGYFVYNIERWKPEILYSVAGNRGKLKVKQGECCGMTIGKKRNKWNISVSNDVPLDIKVDFGAGEGNLDLRGLILNSLEIDMGVGELQVDISGEQKKSLDVSVDGGVGSATIYLPVDVGVRVEVDGGIGSVNARDMIKKRGVYTNDAYGKTEVTIDVDVDAGIGSIDLIMR